MGASPVLFSSTHRFRAVLEVLLESGVDIDAMMRRIGLDAKQLIGPGARVPREYACALGREMVSASGLPDIGLRAAARTRLDDFGLVGYIARHSENALAGLHRFDRYGRLVADAVRLRIERRGAQVILTGMLLGGRPTIPAGVDVEVGGLVAVIREGTNGAATPLRVALPRPRPAAVEPYRRFFGAPVTFEAAAMTLVYPVEPLIAPNPASDPQLLSILERRARDALAELPEIGSLTAQIEGAIARRLAEGDLVFSHIADELGVTARTLRRHISETGRSYRKIVNDVRREHALALLREGRHSVTSVAEHVGFGDSSAFARAFRRWTGSSPRAFRRTRRDPAQVPEAELEEKRARGRRAAPRG